MRGEYKQALLRGLQYRELPPHARRIRTGKVYRVRVLGTTSACAENTPPRKPHPRLGRNYLRMRGEYHIALSFNNVDLELPPHARRIRFPHSCRKTGSGTTSACAENTAATLAISRLAGNYLRMRGEYRLFAGVFIFVSELPPHARRIPSAWACRSSIGGTTSACAENTTCIAVALAPHRNYLRMRGEYGGLGSPRLESEELPPHARRIPRPHTQRLVVPGTTSACAENTPFEQACR